MKRGIFDWVVHTTCCIVIIGCIPNREAAVPDQFLMIFAASSLTNVLPEVLSAFQQTQPGISVNYQFAGSSILATQIIEGAQPDIFLSANPALAARIYDEDLAAAPPITFIHNRLTIAVSNASTITINAINDMMQPDLKIIFASEGVPVRTYTDQLLIKLNGTTGFDMQRVLENVVSEEGNVRLVVAKLALGEGDVSIVYRTDITPDVADSVTARDIIPDNVNPVADYSAVRINTLNATLADDFIVFLQTDAAQAIFAERGFTPLS